MVVTSVGTILSILFETLASSQRTVEQINKACSNKELPPAFLVDNQGNPDIPGNPDYRFEGFGIILGVPPKLSFYVHYKPDSPEHVALGKFTVPIGFAKLVDLNRLLA